jgi:hypothetical protein
MKTLAQRPWMLNSQILLGVYCIISVCYHQQISADLIRGPPSSHTQHSGVPGHKLITSTGSRGKTVKERVNYSYSNEVPKAATTQREKSAIETAQKNANASPKNVILPKIPINIRSITKRSAQDSSFPDEFPSVHNHGNREDFTNLETDCDEDTSFCNKHVYNKDGLQQITGFKLHNKMPLDNRDYSNYYLSDEGTHIPDLQYKNLGLPYSQSIEGSSMYKYHTLPSQKNMNRIADAYTQTHHSIASQLISQFPGVILLYLHKPTTTDLHAESPAVNSNTQQDSLPVPEDNAGQELEPIQEQKKNIFTSRGWGAGGMPFNILYMYQQQMKPTSRSDLARAQQLVAALHGFPPASQHRQMTARNAMSSGRGPRAQTPTRRQYSSIPQLYVSYGWGPQGK